MEVKWMAIAVAVIFASMFGAAAFEAYTKNQCRAAYATSNRTVEEIAKVCR
jgi:hypothetical protein